eukprot:TRINITY_DN1720_c0_g3_i1.p1 TRINITY_DN1720_c0_g3~~TRINITY_DN1720_c0_g3_i1.p1  ORF type:complete len:591 (+),score=57.26 TRINITY_DN1720_c0_g3_i1:168-1940(+)
MSSELDEKSQDCEQELSHVGSDANGSTGIQGQAEVESVGVEQSIGQDSFDNKLRQSEDSQSNLELIQIHVKKKSDESPEPKETPEEDQDKEFPNEPHKDKNDIGAQNSQEHYIGGELNQNNHQHSKPDSRRQYNSEFARTVAKPIKFFASMAHLKTKYYSLNMTWLVLILCLLPAAFALVWFVVLPIGNTYGSRRQKLVWLLVVNPGTFCLLAFTLVNVFLSALDDRKPWRPFWTYAGILACVYVMQVLLPGLVVLFHNPFEALGLVAYAITLVVVLAGLRITPYQWFCNEQEHYLVTLRVFRKICIVMQLYMGILMLYIIMNDLVDSRYTGFFTFVLAIITFIGKKVLLAFTDKYPMEVAMVISGLWLENLEDLFVTLAYPIIPSGISFLIIWLTKVGENVAYLGFQLDIWFKFRVWIKGKFKKSQQGIIEEDLDPDDRGHSNQHPGYRRRQTRFLVGKLVSQISANCFFLIVIPALRYTYNSPFYPFSSDSPKIDSNENDRAIDGLDREDFLQAIYFALASIGTVLVSGFLIWLYMRWKHHEIIQQLRERFEFLVVDDAFFGFVLAIFLSNVLLAVAAVAVPYRMFFF